MAEILNKAYGHGKAFTNHRYNGVYLEFPNGNAISTIWGCGSYSDNHDKSPFEFDKIIREGSMTAEIMLFTNNERLQKRIFRKLESKGDSVIGWVSITDWLWVLNQLANDKQDIDIKE